MGIGSTRYSSAARLDGKTCIITGCNTGIGKFTAFDLYRRGCRVVMACRSVDKAEEARKEIIKKGVGAADCGQLIVKHLDLSSLASVRSFANDIMENENKLNLLINNADAKEIDWDNLNAEKSYSPTNNYSVSKLANILFTKELAKRLEGTKVTVYAVHPGVVNTDLSRHADTAFMPGATWCYQKLGGIFQKDEEQGAATTLHCALSEKAGNETGLYYADCNVTECSSQAKDPELAKKMWEVSAKMVQLNDFHPFTPK